jgi:glycosyltransferase involved in cell wall biosynthesis
MATGLPVISTGNCGDIVEDQVNGFRIPIRSPEAIAEKIDHIIRHPDILEKLSAGAIATLQRFNLVDYQRRLCRALNLYSPAAS